MADAFAGLREGHGAGRGQGRVAGEREDGVPASWRLGMRRGLASSERSGRRTPATQEFSDDGGEGHDVPRPSSPSLMHLAVQAARVPFFLTSHRWYNMLCLSAQPIKCQSSPTCWQTHTQTDKRSIRKATAVHANGRSTHAVPGTRESAVGAGR